MKVLAIDLVQFRAMLGSGEEKFCAKVLRSVPPAAERLNLVKEWKRAVTGLVLGAEGEALSARLPFEKGTKADRALSLAFASLIEAFAVDGLGGPLAGSPAPELFERALFGLEADGDLVRWGGLRKDESAAFASHPLLSPILTQGLDVVGLSRAELEPARVRGATAV